MTCGSFGTVTTCRETPKQIREFVNYHLNAGASCIVLYFDDPDDPAIPQFQNESRVLCRPCDEPHWNSILGRRPLSIEEAQISNLKEGSSILRAKGVSWIASIDSDELLYSAKSIAASLAAAKSDHDVITARPVEAIQHWFMPRKLEFRSRYFRVQRTDADAPAKPVHRRLIGKRENFVKGRLFGHMHGKSVFRAGLPVDEYRLHRVGASTLTLTELSTDDLILLHFDAMTYASWERKWIRRLSGDTVVLKASKWRRRQEKRIRQVFSSDGRRGLKRLFREWHSYSPIALLRLSRQGLLRKVSIPLEWFTHPVQQSL